MIAPGLAIPNPLSIKFGDSASVDAFGYARVSMPETLFDSKLTNDAQPLFWDDQQTSGAGTSSTYNTNQASVTLSVGASAAGTRVRQTFRRFGYQPGKSQLIRMTGVLGSGAAGITRRIGYFDEKNGLFFELAGSILSVARRTYTSGSAVDSSVSQSNWNLDKLDGTGKSGITLDTSKTQVFYIDFEWLGVGRVRFGFVIGGEIVYCHEMNHANSLNVVYMSNPNLPLRYEIVNDGSGAASNLVQICSSVVSEGGQTPAGRVTGIDRSIAVSIGSGAIYPVLSIRKKSTHLDIPINTLFVSVLTTGVANFAWRLLVNPTLTGASWNSITNSAIEYDVAATVITGGTQGYICYVSNSQDGISLPLDDALRLGANIAGTSDILSLAITNLSASPQSFHGALVWREQI